MKNIKSAHKDLTLEDMTNTLLNIFNKPREETRNVVGLRGCLTKGWVDLDEMFHCGNPNCSSCNLMDKLLREEAENFLKESDYIVGIDPYTSDSEGSTGYVWDNKEKKYIINGK